MREKTFFAVGIATAALISLLGALFSQKPWDIINTFIIVNIFVLNVYMYYFLREGDPLYSQSLRAISYFKKENLVFAGIARSVAKALQSEDAFIRDFTTKMLRDMHINMQDLENGIVRIDLRPGGVMLRETDIVDSAKTRIRATSFVAVGQYWQGSSGERILRKNAIAIKERGLKIERIFIENAEDESVLNDVELDNIDAGISVLRTETRKIDPGLIRDFAIVDDGEMAVELVLENRIPKIAIFFSKQSEYGARTIAELEAVWKNLSIHARSSSRPRPVTSPSEAPLAQSSRPPEGGR